MVIEFQEIRESANFTQAGCSYRLVAKIRHDDRCGNGYNTFSITGELYRIVRNKAVLESCGCLHDIIAHRIPIIAPYLCWHLCSTNGPLHYIANTAYHVKNGDLDAAQRSAIWPNATDYELQDQDRLLERLPELMERFKSAVESLGLEY